MRHYDKRRRPKDLGAGIADVIHDKLPPTWQKKDPATSPETPAS